MKEKNIAPKQRNVTYNNVLYHSLKRNAIGQREYMLRLLNVNLFGFKKYNTHLFVTFWVLTSVMARAGDSLTIYAAFYAKRYRSVLTRQKIFEALTVFCDVTFMFRA